MGLKLVTHWLSPRCRWRSQRAPGAREARERKVSKLLWWHECPPNHYRPNSAFPLRDGGGGGEGGIQTDRVRGNERKARQYEKERQKVRIKRETSGVTVTVLFSEQHEFMSMLRCNMKAWSCRREIETVCESKRRHRSTNTLKITHKHI